MKLGQLNIGSNLILYICLCAIMIYSATSYTTPSACNSTSKYYNILTLQCTDCPTNTEQATDFTYCNCTNRYYPNKDAIGFNFTESCLALNATSTYNKLTQILPLYDVTGAALSTIAGVTCSGNAYPLFDQNRCVSCGFDPQLVYNSTIGACQCASGYTKIGQSCYQNTVSWNRNFSSSDTFNYLAQQYVKIGCQQQNLVQPCNMLINMCVRAGYSSSNYFCSLLSNLSSTQSATSLQIFIPIPFRPAYTFSSQLLDSIGIYASSKIGVNTTSVKNQINIIAIEYNVYGQIVEVAPIDKDLFECDVSEDDVARFSSFGLNLYKQCAVERGFSRQAYYDFYVQTSDGSLAQIPIYMDGVYYKRISPSQSTGSHTYTLQFISLPPMLVPLLTIASSTSPTISTISVSASVSVEWIVPFVIFNIVTLVVFVLLMYRYFVYNPSDDPNDPYFLCKGFIYILIKLIYTWSYSLWIWLLGFSLFIFSFYKFQQTIYLIVPDQQTQWGVYYQTFMIIYYAQMIIMAISLWIVIYNKGDVDYFLIDWEKEKEVGKFDVNKQKKEVSVWRRVLLVNELYERAVAREINIYFVTLFALLFLKGLQWINLSYSIPFTTSLTSLSSTSASTNVILSYFIITFIYFIIAVIQKVIRQLIKIWQPLPAEEFVDLCTMTNISVLIFNQYLHGYYIHGVHPLGQAEGDLQYIQGSLEKQAKAFGKGRGFLSQQNDTCQTFQVVFPLALRRNFLMRYKAPLLQKLVPKNYQQQSIFSNPLPSDWDQSDYDQVDQIASSMAENIKMYLQCVKASLRNVQDRSWWVKFISCPVSQDIIGNIPMLLKDAWNEYSNVFISGHEFLFLFNFINLVNLFYVITKNVYFASLIAIILNEIFFYYPACFFIKRNISKNTFIEEKFFN